MFNFTPNDGLLDSDKYPQKPASGTAARQQFMDLFNQIKDYINTLALSSHTHSNYSPTTHTHNTQYLAISGTADNSKKINGKNVFVYKNPYTDGFISIRSKILTDVILYRAFSGRDSIFQFITVCVSAVGNCYAISRIHTFDIAKVVFLVELKRYVAWKV